MDGGELGLKPQFSILDSDDVLGILKDAGGSSDNAQARLAGRGCSRTS